MMLSAELLCGRAATKQAVMERIEKCRIVHFASHGFVHVPDREKVYVPGAIHLSPSSGEAARADSYLLTSLELQQLDLSGLELAVLSCCYTGAGDVGEEGLLGLGRALMFAGCKRIAVAMWKVPDAETRFLMKEFYRHYLRTNDAPSALRSAQMARKDAEALATAWGGFYVLGI